MSTLAPSQTSSELRLDFGTLRKALLFLAPSGLLVALFSQDPVAVAVTCMVPWFLVAIVDKPCMPTAVVFLLLWEWGQIAARLLLAYLDGEALGDGIYGPDLTRAYWYSLASLVTFAVAFRVALDGARPASAQFSEEHLVWKPRMLFGIYLGTVVLSQALAPLRSFAPVVAQPVGALVQLKTVALFSLFATTMSVGRGRQWVFLAVGLEVVMGFGGLFSGFKEVFFILALAALATRVPLKTTTLLLSLVAAVILTGLGTFWTAIKPEYRRLATGDSDVQIIVAPLSERTGWLADKALAPGDIVWGEAFVALIRRFAAIDYFGAVIGVSELASDPEHYERWRDALNHVFTPRLFFPDKAALSDTDVFERRALGGLSDEDRAGTSISIGHMAENFIDFGFPGMLLPMFGMGLLLGGIVRYFMTRPVAWAAREGFALACIMTTSSGMELSLAKFLGGTLTTFVVLAICLRFLYPRIVRWVL